MNVVETVYAGGEYDALLSALRQWSFAGGTPVRNALHEGFAAAMDVIRTILLREESCQLTVICCSLYYEEFQAAVPVQASVVQQGRILEEMLLELRTRGRVRLSCFFPSLELGRTLLNLLGKVYSAEELRPIEIGGWIGRTTEGKQSAASVRSNMSGDSINLDINLDTIELPNSNSLEQAVRQFLSVVLKLPQNQRAEAIKRHLESPTYSAEYKQCLVAMVRQMQNTAKMVRKPQPSISPAARPVTSPSIIPRQSPMVRGANVVSPVWRGRIAFRTNTEAYFDVAAVPIPNPKSSHPQTTPLASEYDLESWPLVLAVSSFVSVQSPAVIKSVPVSKLVELFAVNLEGAPVALVRLGASHAMLVAARPHQLVGMVLSKQAAASLAHPQPAPPPQEASIPKPIVMLPTDPSILARPIIRTSPRASRVLTPDAILRQHKSAPETTPLLPPTQNLDVFNALMGSQSDFDSEPAVMDFCELAFPEMRGDVQNSFFDIPP
ncbi:hypothetical protein PSACC_01218 [Paramicrosporidium saccamoebae]|uniref:Uncharacterized protein n=1 Tax=Paramicrosporidium saccamoebae TaxID=1246581 RepID=A0A2H9TMJ8_9FUNG|nr:hypothetical protein PSACC_01218 [Paramicrosporidium saccamoebae]